MKARHFSMRIVCTHEQKRKIDAFRRDPGPRIETFCSTREGDTHVLALNVPEATRYRFIQLVESLGIKHTIADQWEDKCSK